MKREEKNELRNMLQHTIAWHLMSMCIVFNLYSSLTVHIEELLLLDPNVQKKMHVHEELFT
jgi:hypothetical protein